MAATVAPNPTVPQQKSHPFTCNTCQVAFRGSDLQRSHMQSDWHRYNLKRRVASLPPLTSETFAQKVIANQASAAATAAKAAFEKVCAACQRTYFSENAYQNHLRSQKHRANVASLDAHVDAGDDEVHSMMSSAFSLGEPLDTRSDVDDPAAEAEFSRVVNGMKQTSLNDDSDDPVTRRPTRPHHSSNANKQDHVISTTSEADTISSSTVTASSISDPTPTLSCLFCNKQSESLESNVKHMESVHSMFIPERSYLVNLEGLIKYLNERVYQLHECLYCAQVRHTVIGVKTHMRDKGHCRIAFESEGDMLDIGEFYDFSSTYSDVDEDEENVDEDGQEEDAGVRLGAKRNETYLDERGMEIDNADGDDDEWESDEDMSDVETADGQSQAKKRSRTQAYIDENELHLPSGRTAGHRSQAHIYRQNLRDYPTPEERASRLALTSAESQSEDVETSNARGRQVVSRAAGGMGMIGMSDAKKKEASKTEMRERKREQRAQAKYQWGNARRANFQEHYRDPLLQ